MHRTRNAAWVQAHRGVRIPPSPPSSQKPYFFRELERNQRLELAVRYKRLVQMPLTMARPWKHPDSGVYWFRKGVPVHLRTLVGKREEKVSLQTKDPVEARVRHGKVAADVAARWASLQEVGPRLATAPEPSSQRELSEREAHKIARIFYDNYLTLYSDNPSKGFWKPEVGQTLWREFSPRLFEDTMELHSSFSDQWKLERWCADEARGLCGASRTTVE